MKKILSLLLTLCLLLGLLLAVGLRVFDRVVSCVDLVHLLRGSRIAGVQIRVVFFGQTAICLPDLIFGRVRRNAEDLKRICSHAAHFLSYLNMLIILPFFLRIVKLL